MDLILLIIRRLVATLFGGFFAGDRRIAVSSDFVRLVSPLAERMTVRLVLDRLLRLTSVWRLSPCAVVSPHGRVPQGYPQMRCQRDALASRSLADPSLPKFPSWY
jgi:hypothetical protein